MNCEQMTLLMSAWLDGELSEAEEKQMKEHLEQCAECRALMEQLQALHTSFSDLEEIPAPEGFADSVMERIARESKPKVVPLFKRPQIRSLAALAACAALFVGFGSMRMGGSARSEAAAAPMAPMPESAVYYEAADVESVGEHVMEYSKSVDGPMEAVAPMEPMEPMAPTAGEPAFDAVAETPAAMAPTICETGPNGERVGEDAINEILLPRLPEGLEEKVGSLAWEERAADGALCARLTADEAELVLELASEQGIDGVCVGYAGADGESWLLVLQPN